MLESGMFHKLKEYQPVDKQSTVMGLKYFCDDHFYLVQLPMICEENRMKQPPDRTPDGRYKTHPDGKTAGNAAYVVTAVKQQETAHGDEVVPCNTPQAGVRQSADECSDTIHPAFIPVLPDPSSE